MGKRIMKHTIIAIIGAMNEEVELYLHEMKHQTIHHHASMQFYQGYFQDKEVIVCKTGVGKVNAAIVTQVLNDRFHVSHVIFTGVAGALSPALEIGDMVISTECMHHDMDVTALGFARGEIPFQATSLFPADHNLIRISLEVGNRLFPERVQHGRILSGDQFISDRHQVMILHNELHGICTEMEGAAVAQVCYMNQVPFVIIRSMSDKADGSAPHNFLEFTQKAATNSFCMVSEMIMKI